MRKLAVIWLMIAWSVGAATNGVPPLIIRGKVDTNAAVLWSPWSCWWLRPVTNAMHVTVAANEGETNKLTEATNSALEGTTVVKETVEADQQAAASSENMTEFGASILLGRPIRRHNVEIGQQNLQPGKSAAGLGPNNVQVGPRNMQLGGPNVGGQPPGKAAAGIGQPSGGIGQENVNLKSTQHTQKP